MIPITMTLKDDIRTAQTDGQVMIGGIEFRWDEDDRAIYGNVAKDAYIMLAQKKGGMLMTIRSPEGTESYTRSSYDTSDVIAAIKRLKARLRHQGSLQKKSGQLSPEDVKGLFGGGNLGQAMKLLSIHSDLVGVLNKVLPGRLPKGIGDKLGAGGEGQVFAYGPDRIIKVYIVDTIATAKSVLRTLERIMKRNIPCIAKIFDAGFIGRLVMPQQDLMGKQVMTDESLIYAFYYISERLEEFHPTQEHIDSVIRCLKDNNVEYDDVEDNLMIDKKGTPKLADIGRFIKI